jgi:hypothetical protein
VDVKLRAEEENHTPQKYVQKRFRDLFFLPKPKILGKQKMHRNVMLQKKFKSRHGVDKRLIDRGDVEPGCTGNHLGKVP